MSFPTISRCPTTYTSPDLPYDPIRSSYGLHWPKHKGMMPHAPVQQATITWAPHVNCGHQSLAGPHTSLPCASVEGSAHHYHTYKVGDPAKHHLISPENRSLSLMRVTGHSNQPIAHTWHATLTDHVCHAARLGPTKPVQHHGHLPSAPHDSGYLLLTLNLPSSKHQANWGTIPVTPIWQRLNQVILGLCATRLNLLIDLGLCASRLCVHRFVKPSAHHRGHKIGV